MKKFPQETLAPDGFNSEFFQLFKKEISPVFHKIFWKTEKNWRWIFLTTFKRLMKLWIPNPVKKIQKRKKKSYQQKPKRNIWLRTMTKSANFRMIRNIYRKPRGSIHSVIKKKSWKLYPAEGEEYEDTHYYHFNIVVEGLNVAIRQEKRKRHRSIGIGKEWIKLLFS